MICPIQRGFSYLQDGHVSKYIPPCSLWLPAFLAILVFLQLFPSLGLQIHHSCCLEHFIQLTHGWPPFVFNLRLETTSSKRPSGPPYWVGPPVIPSHITYHICINRNVVVCFPIYSSSRMGTLLYPSCQLSAWQTGEALKIFVEQMWLNGPHFIQSHDSK